MRKWYSCNFSVSWDRGQKPKIWVDIFIIDTIVGKIISQKKSEIALWRIHRRWANDEHGHELTFDLTFDCFTNEEAAKAIESLIKDNMHFKILKEAGLLTDGKELKISPKTNDIASDTGWPEPLKESWPYYINGCCEMFLSLIENIKGGKSVPHDINNAEKFYTEVNNEIIRIWQSFGCNAFFHHISAIFGYEPLSVSMGLWGRF